MTVRRVPRSRTRSRSGASRDPVARRSRRTSCAGRGRAGRVLFAHLLMLRRSRLFSGMSTQPRPGVATCAGRSSGSVERERRRRPASPASPRRTTTFARASSHSPASSGSTAGRPRNVARSIQRGAVDADDPGGLLGGLAVVGLHGQLADAARCRSGPRARWRCRRAGPCRRRSAGGRRSRGRRCAGAAKARSSSGAVRAGQHAPTGRPGSPRRPGAAARGPARARSAATRGRPARRRRRRRRRRRTGRRPWRPRRPRRRLGVASRRRRSDVADLRRNFTTSPQATGSGSATGRSLQ